MREPTTPAEIPGYEIVGLLGEGSMGSVFQARQLSTGQWVAIKMLRIDPGCPDNRIDRLVARFGRETALCAKLHHPHVVRLLDRGSLSARLHYAVFEYLPGKTLRDHLVRHGALQPLHATKLMLQVLDGLACAHQAGIVHRDIKPQNVMVDGEPDNLNATIVDFGIGALLGEQQGFQTASVLTREALGTPSYSAPEQLRGEPPTPRSDLYAWGLMFVECLTGLPVFQGYTLPEVYHAQLSARDVPLPPALIGHPLHALLRKVLAKNPEDRWGDAAAIYRMLAAINVANLVQLPTDPITLGGEGGATSTVPLERTLVNATAPGRAAYEKRHITAMYCGLSIQPVGAPWGQAEGDSGVDTEALEALQRDHLNTVMDTVHRFGGHVMGSLAGAMLFYFGYPKVSDRDGQRAARAALDLIAQTERRAKLLRAQLGIELEMSIGMHVGEVLLTPEMQPGHTATVAQFLQHTAPAGQIHLSEAARRALARFVECIPRGGAAANQGDAAQAGDVAPGRATFLLSRERSSDGFSFLDQGNHAMAGRQAELEGLQALWRSTTQRREGGAALVTGEAGIGKSRLLFEWAAQCAEDGASLSSHCLPEQQHTALYPVLRWVRQAFELDDPRSAPGGLARLKAIWSRAGLDPSHLTALLLSWMSIAPDEIPASLANYSPEMQKQLLLDGLEHVLLSMARERPLCLLLEDVHWIDQSSASFLGRLILLLKDHPVSLVMTARRDEMRWAVPAEVKVIPLTSLDESGLAALLSSLLGGLKLDAALVRAVQEHTAGIPLYVAEFTMLLRARGLLRTEGDTCHLAATLSDDILPSGLLDILGQALQRVGAAKETAQIAAAIGREFDHAMLAEVSECDESTLQTHLQSLTDAGLIIPLRRVGNEHYLFKHALLRSAAYDMLPRAQRTGAHAHIAQALEARLGQQGSTADWVPLAQHHAAAEHFERAVHYGSLAVASALHRAVHDDALELVDTVQGWIDQLPAAERLAPTLQLYNFKVSALMSKFGWADSRVRAAADEAYGVAQQSGQDADVGPILWMLATYHHVASHRADVRDIVRELLKRRLAPGAEHLSLPALAMAGISSWIDGRFQDAHDHLEQALALPDDGADRMGQAVLYGFDCRIWARAALANVCWFRNADLARALRLADQAVGDARELGHIPSLGVALLYQALVHHYAQDFPSSARVAAELREIGSSYGLPALIAYGTVMHSCSIDSPYSTEATLAYLRSMGCMLAQTQFLGLLAEVKFRQGNIQGALQTCTEALILCEEIDERYCQQSLLALKKKLLTNRMPGTGEPSIVAPSGA